MSSGYCLDTDNLFRMNPNNIHTGMMTRYNRFLAKTVIPDIMLLKILPEMSTSPSGNAPYQVTSKALFNLWKSDPNYVSSREKIIGDLCVTLC
ncbi:hypothetical protein Xekj_01193 [Xenorhabdus sp. KJ12.1]|nr:hypothetical protein Xekj_01193 [Xenorhabdus sp. KJ12.1]